MAKQPELLTENEDKDDEYVIVDEPIVEKPEEKLEEDDDEEKSSSKASDEDDEENDGLDDDEDREAIRERRRQEKRERKERREKAIGRDKTELNFLRQRNDELERRVMAIEGFTHKSTVTSLDNQIREAMQEAETAERIIAKAVEAGNGEDVTKALKYRDQAMTRAQQLYNQKQAAEVPQQRQPEIDNAVAHYAKEFIDNNKWYNPQGADEDSAIVLAIDNRLMQEGYDPRSEEYWEELNSRVKRRLPEKFESAPRAERKPTGSPPVGSGREHAPTTTRKEIYISPERKAAMMEAGVWDDPVLRKRYIKRYEEYDRNNRDK